MGADAGGGGGCRQLSIPSAPWRPGDQRAPPGPWYQAEGPRHTLAFISKLNYLMNHNAALLQKMDKNQDSLAKNIKSPREATSQV